MLDRIAKILKGDWSKTSRPLPTRSNQPTAPLPSIADQNRDLDGRVGAWSEKDGVREYTF